MDLKTIDQLEIDYSKYQLYRRVKRLEEENLIDPQRGGRNQILLKPEDVEVLQRLAELEHDYTNVQSAMVQLENEELQGKVNKLEGEKEKLENELVARNNVIQRLRGNWLERLQESFQSVVNWFKSP